MDPLVFEDLAPIEIPVRIFGKDYLLREASEDAACKWRAYMFRSSKPDENGKPTALDGLPDSEPYLVHLCLWEGDKLVPLALVRNWPARMVKTLHTKLKEISGLNEEEEATAPTRPAEGNATDGQPSTGPPTSATRTMWG